MTRLAALTLSVAMLASPALADCRVHNVNEFWLVELAGESRESATVVATFDSSPACVAASVEHQLTGNNAFFAVCVPLDVCGEAEHAEYMAHEYGLIEGDF